MTIRCSRCLMEKFDLFKKCKTIVNNVKKQIEIRERCGRELWAEKNKTYLN